MLKLTADHGFIAGDWLCSIFTREGTQVWGFLPGMEFRAHKVDAMGKLLMLRIMQCLCIKLTCMPAFSWIHIKCHTQMLEIIKSLLLFEMELIYALNKFKEVLGIGTKL